MFHCGDPSAAGTHPSPCCAIIYRNRNKFIHRLIQKYAAPRQMAVPLSRFGMILITIVVPGLMELSGDLKSRLIAKTVVFVFPFQFRPPMPAFELVDRNIDGCAFAGVQLDNAWLSWVHLMIKPEYTPGRMTEIKLQRSHLFINFCHKVCHYSRYGK